MPAPVTLEFIGATLHRIQAEQRTLRDENALIRAELGRLAGQMATRAELSEVLRVLVDRISNFEALMEARLDQVLARLPPPDRGGAP